MPFVAKAVGHPIAKYASLAMAGKTLAEIGLTEEPIPTTHVAVKEVVLPFAKFPGADTLLGPEMRSTGEVMGIDKDFASAYAKVRGCGRGRTCEGIQGLRRVVWGRVAGVDGCVCEVFFGGGGGGARSFAFRRGLGGKVNLGFGYPMVPCCFIGSDCSCFSLARHF